MIASGSRPTVRAAALSDPELFARLAAGQLGALGDLYDRYHAPVRTFLARATRDADDVDDLVHATFLEAAKSAERYDGRDNGRPWLIGIAALLLRRRHRSVARFVSALTSLKGALHASADPRPSLQARTDLERALARLSEAKRTTLLMAEVEGLTAPEIAAALAIPVGTVWTRLHAARKELREFLAPARSEEP